MGKMNNKHLCSFLDRGFEMIVAGIIAEFNPFHSGHKYLIDKCRKELGADRIVVVMSGDYVQRGAPAIMDKFARARMALRSGADLVLELPVYYSLGSAEFFAEGAVSILDKLGCVNYLCFGSETPQLDKLEGIADILYREPRDYKTTLNALLKAGESFASARAAALSVVLQTNENSMELDAEECSQIVSSPNNILAIEYLKALNRRKSSIKPYTTQRIGAPYHSLEEVAVQSASGIRAKMLSGDSPYIKEKAPDILGGFVPDEAICEIADYNGYFLNSNDFSEIMHYKLLSESLHGYTSYLDVSSDLSNRIQNNLESFDSFTYFCQNLKTKNLTHTRISRCLLHILLGITQDNMSAYKSDDYTAFARILGMGASAGDLLGCIQDRTSIPVVERLKTADKLLTPLQMQLLNETLTSSSIYDTIAQNEITSEYRLKPVIIN